MSELGLYTPLQWHIQRYGYGWSLHRAISWAAVAAITLHVMLVILHVLIVVVRRRRFEAWDNLEEIVALTNKSPVLDALHGLGVGDALSRNEIIER